MDDGTPEPNLPVAQGQLFRPDVPDEQWPAHRLEVPPLRVCGGCRRLLTVDDYDDNRRTRDGLSGSCKLCVLAAARRHRGVAARHARMRPSPDQVCEICSDDGGTRGLFLDHDHATGQFRGWLCHYCNTGIGAFKDAPGLLRKAIRYLCSPDERAA